MNTSLGQRLTRILTITIAVLAVPLIAMQFSDDVSWGPGDFIVMGVLVVGAGLVYELVIRKVRDHRRRIVAAAALLALFVFVWAELAVGIVGTPFAGS